MRRFPAIILLPFLLGAASFSFSQSPDSSPVLSRFPFEDTVPLKIVRDAIPSHPFSVVGPRGAILGHQDGAFEAWIFPWKIFSNLRITADMQNYPVPIDVNDQAASSKFAPITPPSPSLTPISPCVRFSSLRTTPLMALASSHSSKSRPSAP